MGIKTRLELNQFLTLVKGLLTTPVNSGQYALFA